MITKGVKSYLTKELFSEDIKYIDPDYVVHIVEICIQLYEDDRKCVDLNGIDKIIDELEKKYPRSKKALGEVIPLLMKLE